MCSTSTYKRLSLSSLSFSLYLFILLSSFEVKTLSCTSIQCDSAYVYYADIVYSVHNVWMCVVIDSSQMTWSDVVSDINEVKTPIYNC